MKDRGVIGDGWLFLHTDGEAVNTARAAYLLKMAEAAANVPPQARGG
ncbi:MAG TPA: hypothetical protein VMN39_04210 [Longimicrobiaceae bacterium]|nr:hypothetical protein [Longimicrobiaceae bacterium]